MFYDLNVPAESAGDLPLVAERLGTLVRLGYNVVAINQTVSGRISGVVEPFFPDGVQLPRLATARLQAAGRHLKVLKRVTVVLRDPNEAYALGGTFFGLRDFDLVAAQPATEKLFAQCTEKLDIDIISLDLSQRLPYQIKPPQVRQALSRGVHFEICYSAAITDGRARSQLIANAQNLVRISKGRGLLITSEAKRAMSIRGPYDIANLGRLFGLSINQAKEAISSAGRLVVMHGDMRARTWKGVLEVQLARRDAEEEKEGGAMVEKADA